MNDEYCIVSLDDLLAAIDALEWFEDDRPQLTKPVLEKLYTAMQRNRVCWNAQAWNAWYDKEWGKK